MCWFFRCMIGVFSAMQMLSTLISYIHSFQNISTFCRFVPEELEQWAISVVLASGGIMSSA